MPLVEKLGSFYLGKDFSLETGKVADSPVNYDSRDLTTHAVCVGMTGSGKTGLCIDLLEEAAIDNVPALLIDPKGDITNLLLTFPELRPEDFLPWINPEDAERKGLTPDAYAAQTADQWRQGLASWDQGPERIQMLKQAVDFAIYTPGSEAGLPISMVSSFKAPNLDWDTESETLRDGIQGIVGALLGLVGIEADPLRSREHILLSNILETSWRAGKDMDLGGLIMAVQKPPFSKLGVFDLDTFYPEKDRFELAMSLNNMIASPSFAAWMTGEPLDIAALLRTPSGKPRHSIFYIAHLNDAERMFFVTLLLEQVIAWMRAQPGTTSLRALVYMDEVFGFFPPLGNPPSKRPLLTLMKQARAFGVGMVLTTQNPADLDYKGLGNAGTWFIGKLQAERDKARLMEGLTSAMADAGQLTDPKVLDKLIASLQQRVFLLHNTNRNAPVVFQTRWAMSYLRGPLTRQQIKQLMAGRKAGQGQATAAAGTAGGSAAAMAAARPVAAAGAAAVAASNADLMAQPPGLPAAINQVYLPLTMSPNEAVKAVADHAGAPVAPSAQQLIYEPALVGLATVRFVDRKLDVDETSDCAYLLPLSDAGPVISWKDATAVKLDPHDLAEEPEANALFRTDLPGGMSGIKNLNAQSKDFVDFLYRGQVYNLAYNPTLKLFAKPGESERDFRARCQQAAREARDAAVDKLADKYDTQIQRLDDRLAKAQNDLADSKAEYSGRQQEELVSGLSTVVGALGLFGRRSSRGLSSVATKRRLSQSAKADIAEAQADIDRIQDDIKDVKAKMQDEANALGDEWQKAADDLQETTISPKKTDVEVHVVALAWLGSWQIQYDDAKGRTRTETVPAYPMS